MTLTVGRIGLDVTLDGVQGWNQSGDTIDVTGFLRASTLADSRVLRQQLSGYVGNLDEEIVPLTWTHDPTVDGYYRVKSASVAADPASGTTRLFPFSLGLERVGAYASPLFQSRLIGAVRQNSLSIVSGTPWHSVPAAATEYGPLDQLDASSLVTRVADDGNMIYRSLTSYYDRLLQFYMPPASFYDGSSRIEVGTTLRTVVGEQIENLPLAWRLSNGLVRVTPSATAGQLDISHYDGSAWDTAVTYKITIDATLVDDFTNLTVLRNSPEETVIRLSCATATFAHGPMRLDLSLRRGSRFVSCVYTHVVAVSGGLVVARSSAEAATAITSGGIRATSNDASGNRYVILAPNIDTTDLVNGSVTVDPVASTLVYPFAIASEVTGSSAASPDRATDIRDQYFAAQAEAMNIVRR